MSNYNVTNPIITSTIRVKTISRINIQLSYSSIFDERVHLDTTY